MINKEYDVNMITKEVIDERDVAFYDIKEAPIRLCGAWYEGGRYVRVPGAVAKTVSEGIARTHCTTAGARIRFKTNSEVIYVKAVYEWYNLISVNPHTLTVGFDLYTDGKYEATFRPDAAFTGGTQIYRATMEGAKEREITIYMPTHCCLNEVFVGIDAGAFISHASDYKHEKPIVFYGSSITHGSSASRPGMSYVSQLCRMLEANYHNIGFGGLAKGEGAMAEYIASLDMSVFVFDYDHNTPSNEHLLATHEPFFKIIREKHPDLPVVMISRPTDSCGAKDTKVRFDIIKRTYDNAVASGDKNVYLINGLEFFGEAAKEFTVDKTHPTDLGFYLMAQRIFKVIKPLLD